MGRDAVAVVVILGLALAVGVLHGLAARPPQPAAAAREPGEEGAGAGLRLYVVEPGDTLYAIAARFGTTVSVLTSLNGLEDPDRITVGQVLRVPDPEAGQTVPALAPPRAALPGAPARVLPLERHLLAALIWHEARGEPFEGQIAVGAVVLNRVRHPAFPDTILGVLTQPGQFPFTLDQLERTRPDPWAYAAADRALAGEDPTGGALYFYNPDKTTTPEFWATRPVLARIGRHVFTR